MKQISLDENAKKLIKKCENNEIDTGTMGAYHILLKEMDRGNVILKDEPGQSYIRWHKIFNRRMCLKFLELYL